MKRLLLVISLLTLPLVSLAQNTYTVNKETLELKTEVSGGITLLWNIIDGKYRYFIKQGNTITELKNTKGNTRKFQEEYKSVLATATNNFKGFEKVNLTLPSLSAYIDAFNTSQDSNYKSTVVKTKLQSNLLLFGGLTNHPFIENEENASNPIFGLEIEFFNPHKLKNHALFFGVNHALSSDKFDYSQTQFNLGYRYRFVNKPSYNIYASSALVTYTISKEIKIYEDNNTTVQDEISGNSLDAPLSFGIGADFKLSDYSYITVTYNDIFAILVKNEGNFSTYFNVGYKITL